MAPPIVRKCANCKFLLTPVNVEPCRTCKPHKLKTFWRYAGDVSPEPERIVPLPEQDTKMSEATQKQVGGTHYDMPIQPIEFIVKNDIPYREGNAIKYICRHSKKNGAEDIRKAIHYLEMILEAYE